MHRYTLLASTPKSSMFLLIISSAIILLSELPPSDAQFSPADYGRTFFGDATYYGLTDAGNCGFRNRPAEYKGMLAVAINEAQYAGSLSCGACVKLSGSGRGSGANPIVGTRIAIVHDRCPECHHGSLDLSESGDGRWAINFTFVECPFEQSLSFYFEGSNNWYWKIQARGLKYPVRGIRANGVTGTRTNDNFFVLQNSRQHALPATVYVDDIMGNSYSAVINSITNEAEIRPESVQ